MVQSARASLVLVALSAACAPPPAQPPEPPAPTTSVAVPVASPQDAAPESEPADRADARPPSDGICRGQTATGSHWIGACQPKLVVVEFTDYECRFCGPAHRKMRLLVERNPTVMRLVVRNFPLDASCNPTMHGPFHRLACSYARLAACAGEQGRFWEAGEAIHELAQRKQEITPAQLESLVALDTGRLEACIRERGDELLQADLAEGERLGIRGTPTFLVDGQTYGGKVPDEVLRKYGVTPVGARP